MRSRSAAPVSRRARRLTRATVVAVAGCLVAGGFELSRAVAGNSLSWVYAVEWPLVAVYAIYMRHKLMADARAEHPAGTRAPTILADTDVESSTGDPQLVAWQEYLDRLHSASPPGGPPPNEQES